MDTFTFVVKDRKDLKSFKKKELSKLPFYELISERPEGSSLRIRILVRACDKEWAKCLCLGKLVKD